jgi:hypothetical protein
MRNSCTACFRFRILALSIRSMCVYYRFYIAKHCIVVAMPSYTHWSVVKTRSMQSVWKTWPQTVDVKSCCEKDRPSRQMEHSDVDASAIMFAVSQESRYFWIFEWQYRLNFELLLDMFHHTITVIQNPRMVLSRIVTELVYLVTELHARM